MHQKIDAIFQNGALRPISPLDLKEDLRVRLVIDSEDYGIQMTRDEALQRLFYDISKVGLDAGGCLPTREELHDSH